MKHILLFILITLVSTTIFSQPQISRYTKSTAIKSFKADTCNCGDRFNNLPNPFIVKMNYPTYNYNDPKTITCITKICDRPIELDAPYLGNTDCFKYEWYIKSIKMPTAADPLNTYRCISMTGQGTSHVSIGCKDIKEILYHDGGVTITCNGRTKLGVVETIAIKACSDK